MVSGNRESDPLRGLEMITSEKTSYRGGQKDVLLDPKQIILCSITSPKTANQDSASGVVQNGINRDGTSARANILNI